MSDGSYTRVDRYDPKATKVYYYGGDHSAVIPSSGSAYFISKWGSACLMKHTPADCPYDSSNLKYYKLSMEISGDATIALPSVGSTEIRTYTLSNVPAGATVEWSVSSSGATIVGGQGTSSVRLRFTGGSYTVRAKVHCPKGGKVIDIPFSVDVRVSAAPIVTDIEMFKYIQDTGEFTLRAVSNNPEGTFSWSVSGGNAQFCSLPYPDDASFAMQPNIYTAIRFYEPGTYTITVTSRAAGVSDVGSFSKDFTVTEAYSGSGPLL